MGSICMKDSTRIDSKTEELRMSTVRAPRLRTKTCAPVVRAPHEAMLSSAYGKETIQLGYNTDGHLAVSDLDIMTARRTGCSLLYGEVLPQGVARLLSPPYLDASNATSLADLGMGTGKLALQAFLMYPNLKEVIGIELSQARYEIAQAALLRLVAVYPSEFRIGLMKRSSEVALVTRLGPQRVLRFVRGNMLDVSSLFQPDIVVLETELPARLYRRLAGLLTTMHSGARLLTYTSLTEVWHHLNTPFRFHQRPSPKVLTSWSWRRGHSFFCWQKASLIDDTLRLESCADAEAAMDDDGVSTSSSAASQPATLPPQLPPSTRLPSSTFLSSSDGDSNTTVGTVAYSDRGVVNWSPSSLHTTCTTTTTNNNNITATMSQVVVASPQQQQQQQQQRPTDSGDGGPLFHVSPRRPRSAASRLQQKPLVVAWKPQSRMRPGSADTPKRIDVRPRTPQSNRSRSRPRLPATTG